MVWRGLYHVFNYKFYNYLNSQDDIKKNSNIFSDIVKLLNDEDHFIVNQTVEMVKHILERSGGREMVVNTPEMVASLIEVLNSSNDLDTTNITSDIIYSLSQCKTGLLSIYQSNGIPVLVQLLSASVESLVRLAAATLRNLLANQKGSKAAVCKTGGLQKMMILLKQNNKTFLSIVIDCLQILAYRSQQNKLLIFSSDGPGELVRILSTSSCQTLLYSTSGLLKTLSDCSINKSTIIAAGGMEALVKHLNNPSRELVINCLWTLRYLFDGFNKQEIVGSFFQILVQFLKDGDKNIASCSAGILSNLTCNNVSNKMIVCQEKGISALVNVISEAANTEVTIESAICALRNLTQKHPEAGTAQNVVRLHSGLQPIVKLLHHNSNLHLIKAVIELVRNLTLCPNNHEPLGELDTVGILTTMLNYFYQHMTKNRGGLPYYLTQPCIIQGVKMEDLVEDILSALLNLARNVNVRAILKNAEIMNIFFRILLSEHENIQVIVVSLFSEIASDPGGILIVESLRSVQFLYTLLYSNNKALSSKCRSLMVQLFALKPNDYYNFINKPIMKQ